MPHDLDDLTAAFQAANVETRDVSGQVDHDGQMRQFFEWARLYNDDQKNFILTLLEDKDYDLVSEFTRQYAALRWR